MDRALQLELDRQAWETASAHRPIIEAASDRVEVDFLSPDTLDEWRLWVLRALDGGFSWERLRFMARRISGGDEDHPAHRLADDFIRSMPASLERLYESAPGARLGEAQGAYGGQAGPGGGGVPAVKVVRGASEARSLLLESRGIGLDRVAPEVLGRDQRGPGSLLHHAGAGRRLDTPPGEGGRRRCRQGADPSAGRRRAGGDRGAVLGGLRCLRPRSVGGGGGAEAVGAAGPGVSRGVEAQGLDGPRPRLRRGRQPGRERGRLYPGRHRIVPLHGADDRDTGQGGRR